MAIAAHWLQLTAQVLAVAAFPFLAVALLRRARDGTLVGRPSVGSSVAMAWVGALTMGAVVTAVREGMPLGAQLAPGLALALLCVLLLRDERFWVAAATLVTTYTAIGLVLLFGLAHNFGSTGSTEPKDDAYWYGGRQLVHWGGLHANPERPGWQATVVALAVLRYGLPLGMTVATGWLAATRRSLRRGDRAVLVLAGGSLLTGSIFGALVTVIDFSFGAQLGLPIVVAFAGVLGGAFTLLTVGPGAIGGALVGGRSLVSRVPDGASAAYGLVSSLRGTHAAATATAPEREDGPWLRSLARHLRPRPTRTQRLAYRSFAAVLVLVLGYGVAASGHWSSMDMAPVRFEVVDRARSVGFPVRTAYATSDGTGVILGDGGEVATFDPDIGQVRRLAVRVEAAALQPDRAAVVALTREAAPRLIAIRGGSIETLRSVPRGVRGQIAVTAAQVYVAGRDGSLRRFPLQGGGAPTRVTTDGIGWMATLGPDVWTISKRPTRDDPHRYRAERHDPLTLAIVETVDGSDLPGGVSFLGDSLGIAVFDTASSRFVKVTHEDGSSALPPADTEWRVDGDRPGRVGHVEGGATVTYDHHYDTVHAVLRGATGTWLVVEDDRGVVVDVGAHAHGAVVRWSDPPHR